jgi:hypothetical protein
MSTVASNGFAGIQITPRWASNIYYNASPDPTRIAAYAKILLSAIWQTAQLLSGLQHLQEKAIFLRS